SAPGVNRTPDLQVHGHRHRHVQRHRAPVGAHQSRTALAERSDDPLATSGQSDLALNSSVEITLGDEKVAPQQGPSELLTCATTPSAVGDGRPTGKKRLALAFTW